MSLCRRLCSRVVCTDRGHRRLLSGNKFVPDSIFWLQSSIGVPAHTTRQKVKERFIITLENLLKALRRRPASASFGRHGESWLSEGVEKEFLAGALLNQMLFRGAEYFHNASKLFLFIFSREDWIASEKFGQNAPNTPHVDRHTVGHPQDDFGRSVEP